MASLWPPRRVTVAGSKTPQEIAKEKERDERKKANDDLINRLGLRKKPGSGSGSPPATPTGG